MDPKDLAKWAAKFAKKGIGGAVTQESARPQVPAPQRQPAWTAPQQWRPEPPRRGQVWGPPPETDTLVKPAPSAYADILARVPDLAPDMSGGADSMSGRMSPESQAALQEAAIPSEGVRPEDPRDAAPRGYRGAAGVTVIVPLADLAGKPN